VAETPDDADADLQRLLFTPPDGPAPPSSAALPVGYTIDAYRVEGVLGRGGMGVVYAARDERTGRRIALKLAGPEAADDPRVAERARREGVAAAALRHPGIVRVHAAGTHEGRPYLAFELVEGARHLDEAAAGAPLADRVALVRDAARALGSAHTAGVVHRDVKSANLLVDGAGRVRVADFGLAVLGAEARLTRTGALVGTPAGMAPEQLRGRPVGPPTDVWALGVVLYELLAGRPPFEAPSLPELVGKVLAVEPPAPSTVDPAVPPALDAVVACALAKAPAARYADGEALARALEAALAAPSPPRRRRRLRRAAAALAVVAGAAGLGAVAVARSARVERARATVARVAAWESERVVPWGLGLAGGSAPGADALAARRAAVEEAAGALDGPEATAAAELARRLAAARRVRTDAAPPALEPDPLDAERAARALLLERAGRTGAALDLVVGPSPGPLTGLAAVELLARHRPRALLVRCADLPADPAVEALARRRVPEAVEATCRALLRDGGAEEAGAVAGLLAGLPARVADPAALAAARGRTLDAEAAVWGARLGNASDARATRAALEPVAVVAETPTPARAGAATRRAGREAILALLGDRYQEGWRPDDHLRPALSVMERLAVVGIDLPEPLAESIFWRLLDPNRPVPPAVFLAALRFGLGLDDRRTFHESRRLFGLDVDSGYAFHALGRMLQVDAAAAWLREADPAGRRVRFCRLALALRGDEVDRGPDLGSDARALARAVLAPDARPDLAPGYMAEARLLLAEDALARAADRPVGSAERARLQRAALAGAEAALADLVPGDLSAVVADVGAEAARGLGARARGDALLAEVIAGLEAARGARPSRPGRPGRPDRPDRPLAKALVRRAAWRLAAGEGADVDLARAEAVMAALDPRSEAIVRAYGAERLAAAGAEAAAEAFRGR